MRLLRFSLLLLSYLKAAPSFVKILFGLNRVLVFLCVVCAATIAFACDQLPPGQSLWIRLASPVTTYTAKVGDPVHAVLTQDLVCDNEILLPMGADIEGIVRGKRRVSRGIRHETAALALEFHHAAARPGVDIAFTARVEEVAGRMAVTALRHRPAVERQPDNPCMPLQRRPDIARLLFRP